MHTSRRLSTLLAASTVWLSVSAGNAAAGHTNGLCETAATDHASPPYVIVLSAFPAELAPLVAAADIESTVEAGGRPYYVGRLEGVSVILGLMGIGIANARTSTTSVLSTFDAAAVIVNGVAGSNRRIGDVVVATDWMEKDQDGVFHPNKALFALARLAKTNLPAPLEKCTQVPPGAPDSHTVCMPFTPTVVFGGTGTTSDPNGGNPIPCIPNGGPLFGCELPTAMTAGISVAMKPKPKSSNTVEDEETAAVARAADEADVPFLGIRAVSDGAGDPLGDRGFPFQFADYYDLAAHNVSAVTRAVVAEVGKLATDRSARDTCRQLAKGSWKHAATQILRRRGQ